MSKLNLTLLVGSSDKYFNLMPNFVKQYNKYTDMDIERIVVGETKSHDFPGFKYLTPGAGIPWSDRIGIALSKITTDFTFFLLDDYYLCTRLSKEFFEWVVTFLTRENGNKLLICPVDAETNYTYEESIDTYRRMSPNSVWLASMQASVWRTDQLRKLARPGLDAWQFESMGSDFLKGTEKGHFVCNMDKTINFNVARLGAQMNHHWEDFFKSEGLELITI